MLFIISMLTKASTCFQAHITHPHTFPTCNNPHSPTHSNNVKTTPPPPPPRWAKPPFPKMSLSPKSEALCFTPSNKVTNGNITVTTTVTFSVNNTQIHNHQINESIQSDRLQLTLASNAMNNNNSDAGLSIMDASKCITDSNGDLQVSRYTIINLKSMARIWQSACFCCSGQLICLLLYNRYCY